VQGILHYSLYVLAPNVSASVHSMEHKSVFNDARYTGFGYNEVISRGTFSFKVVDDGLYSDRLMGQGGDLSR
jgi:hypothetical protein